MPLCENRLGPSLWGDCRLGSGCVNSPSLQVVGVIPFWWVLQGNRIATTYFSWGPPKKKTRPYDGVLYLGTRNGDESLCAILLHLKAKIAG